MAEPLNLGAVEEYVCPQEAVFNAHIPPPFSVELYTEVFDPMPKFCIKQHQSLHIINLDFVGGMHSFWSQIHGIHIFGVSQITEITAQMGCAIGAVLTTVPSNV